MLKAAIKHSSGEDQVRHRIVPTEILQSWVEKLAGLTEEVAAILKEEKEEKHACHILLQHIILVTNHHTQIRRAEMELKKGQNMIEHEAEIFSRPARTWFQTSKEKQKAEGSSTTSNFWILIYTIFPRFG